MSILPEDLAAGTVSAAKTPGRLGPRPLPLHLMSAMTAWMSSYAALPLLKSGWPQSKPGQAGGLTAELQALVAQLGAIASKDFEAALDYEIRSQADSFLRGVEAYRHHPQRRHVPEPPTIWQEGTTRLLDFRPQGGLPLLVVPSLINRSYILDLTENRSLLRFLASKGIRPLLVDWGRPGQVERGFSLNDYVAERLDAAFEQAAELAGAPIAVLGYCMGGLLALALAIRRQREVAALVLLATPWDFHAEQPEHAALLGRLAPAFDLSLAAIGEVPVDMLQALFFALDPLLALRKFSRFGRLDPNDDEARHFVAIEDWSNDGVPLALPVARECLGGWYGSNEPALGTWRIAGSPILPSQFKRPSLVVIPARDRIVPPASARALAAALPTAARLLPPLGHVGICAAHAAEGAVWQPLARWLSQTTTELGR